MGTTASMAEVHRQSAQLCLAAATHPSPSTCGGPSVATTGPTKVKKNGAGAPGA
ncbi:MAG: hypothetical protein ACRENE_24700 [Polyangiaceae bacterium]